MSSRLRRALIIVRESLLNGLAGNLFVGKNWRQEVSKRIHEILSSEQKLVVAYCPEGYIWSPENHNRAIEFAESRGIKPFKYHLVPRAKGFNPIPKKLVRFSECVGQRVHVYNLQIVYGQNATLMNWLNGS